MNEWIICPYCGTMMTEDKAYAIAKVLGYKFDIVGYADNYVEAVEDRSVDDILGE